MSGSHNAAEPTRETENDQTWISSAIHYQGEMIARLARELAELRTALRVSGHGSAARIEPPPAEATQYDLPTADQRSADELAGLGMRLDNAVDAVNVTALRVSRLEELVAVQRAAIERLADALTVIQLRAGL